jgi:hypothetical protein
MSSLKSNSSRDVVRAQRDGEKAGEGGGPNGGGNERGLIPSESIASK